MNGRFLSISMPHATFQNNERWVRFGQWIQNLRRSIKLTQKAMSEQLGISEKQVSRIETGASGTRYDQIENILKALSIPLDDPRARRTYEIAGFAPPGIARDFRIDRDGSMRVLDSDGSGSRPATEADIDALRDLLAQQNALLKKLSDQIQIEKEPPVPSP